MLIDQGKYYIYRHIRLDTREPFYVGLGSKKNRTFYSFKTEYERAFVRKNRNEWWNNIIKKTDYIVEIICESNSIDFIRKKEQEFIFIYKKTLCNLTLGGEGTLGLSPWNKGIKMWNSEMIHPNKGKVLSEETKNRKSESMKKSPYNWKGKNLSKETVEKIRNSKIGDKNPMYGKLSHRAKKVINTVTNIEYNSIMDAAKSTPYQFQYISAMLNGTRKNITNLKYKNGL